MPVTVFSLGEHGKPHDLDLDQPPVLVLVLILALFLFLVFGLHVCDPLVAFLVTLSFDRHAPSTPTDA